MIIDYKSFLESNTLQDIYKGLYITPLIVEKSHCYILDFYEKDFKKMITELCTFINEKYKDVIVINMRKHPMPGLIIKKEGNIQHIANDIYAFFNKSETDVRIVYGEGTMEKLSNNIHTSWGDLVIKIGRYSDKLKGKKGIFKA